MIEVKSRVSKGDVAELSRIGRLYELKEGVKPRLLMIGFVDEKSLDQEGQASPFRAGRRSAS